MQEEDIRDISTPAGFLENIVRPAGERQARINATPLIRKLNEAEQTMILNPRGMAEMHWSDVAENLNPYKKHSHEWNQYENKHAELEARFDRSF